MEIQGSHQFNAPLTKVWNSLLDPTVLAKALPGGDALERVDENDYKAAMNVRVGPVQGRFEGKVTLLDVVDHQSYRMKVSGSGSAGFLNGEGLLVFAENPEGTMLTYNGDVQVGGRIAAVGQRLIESSAKSIIRQGFQALDTQIGNGGDAPGIADAPPIAIAEPRREEIPAIEPIPVPEPVPSPTPVATPRSNPTPSSAPSTAASSPDFGQIAMDVAKDVVQDLASDYIPREKQPQVFAFILGALSMLLFVVLVRLVQRD
jgi:carbon monoxide dehydrogenase subunit G